MPEPEQSQARSILESEEIDLGSERVGRTRVGDAVLVFASGPRFRVEAPEHRARRLLDTLGGEMSALRWCRQVHGTAVLSIRGAGPGTALCAGVGDGLVTSTSRVGLLVWTADCVPVLIAGPGVVAAVHAGWRGTAGGILKTAVERLEALVGVSPNELVVALGSAVGPCCYPVGAEVITALGAHAVDERSWLLDDRADLRGHLAAQARRLGVGDVVMVGGCTACDPGLASYRRDGSSAGRQLSMVYLTGPGTDEASLEPNGGGCRSR